MPSMTIKIESSFFFPRVSLKTLFDDYLSRRRFFVLSTKVISGKKLRMFCKFLKLENVEVEEALRVMSQ